MIKQYLSKSAVFVSFFLLAAILAAQTPAPGLLDAQALKHAVPGAYFFHGQSATVQLRNSAGFRTSDGKLVLAGLVDTSGYATDVAAKYQGFFITEVKLNIEGTDLAPGEYGFGFAKDGKFTLMDAGGNDIFSVSGHLDDGLVHAVPLKMVADGDGYRLYAGKKWVGVKVE